MPHPQQQMKSSSVVRVNTSYIRLYWIRLSFSIYLFVSTTEADYDYKNDFQDVDRSNAGSSKTAYYNVVCVIAGTGTLGLPFALRQGGWIGVLILFLAWFMSTVSY